MFTFTAWTYSHISAATLPWRKSSPFLSLVRGGSSIICEQRVDLLRFLYKLGMTNRQRSQVVHLVLYSCCIILLLYLHMSKAREGQGYFWEPSAMGCEPQDWYELRFLLAQLEGLKAIIMTSVLLTSDTVTVSRLLWFLPSMHTTSTRKY